MWPFDYFQKPAPAPERIEPGRKKRLYGGAAMGRLTSDWVAASTSQDSEIRSSLRILRNRTRELCRDSDYAKNALRAIRNNVVGHGIGMQSQVRQQRGGKLNEKVNQAIEAAWQDWKHPENCHVAGKLSFADIEKMVIAAVAESGEVLIRKIKGQAFGTSPVPFSLQVLESDYLDDYYNGQNGPNQIRMGVEVNPWGRPVAYWLFQNHPGDYQFRSTGGEPRRLRVPAEEIIHLFVPDRLGQTRGVPWFSSALMRLNNMKGYEEAEIIAARATAAVMGFIESPDGDSEGDDVEDGERVANFEPGMIKNLRPGEKMSFFSPQRPNGQLDPFMRFMLRGFAAGVGCSYETISKDYSQSNYSSSRLAILDDRDNWRILQSWMIENFHRRVFADFVEMAVMSNTLDLPGFEINPRAYDQPRWLPRGWAWVDPAKETTANVNAVRAGFKTVADVIAESGSADFEDVMTARKRELELTEELGIVLDTDPSQVAQTGVVQPIPPTDADAEDAAPAGGDDEAKQPDKAGQQKD